MTGVYLTRIEGRSFDAQTVMVGGFAYVDCQFVNCTLVLTNGPCVLDRCSFTNCNWQLNFLLTSADASSREMLRSLLDQMDAGDAMSVSSN